MFEKLIFLTDKCSQNCYFCFKPDNIGARDLAGVKREIDSAAAQGCKMIAFTGGEPTLYAHFIEAVRHASSCGVFESISAQTNAITFAEPGKAMEFKQAGATRVLVPLHSHMEKLSDELTQRPGTWRKTLMGIYNLYESGLIIAINTVVNSVNYKYLPSLVRFISAKIPFASVITISVVNPDGQAYVNKWIVPKYSEIAPYVAEAHKILGELGTASRNPDCGMPLCFLKGAEASSEDFRRTAISVPNDADKKIISETITAHKAKSLRCRECIHNSICDGIWVRYSEIHGFDEIVPVTS